MGLVRFYACEGDPLRVALKLVLKAREQGQAVQVCGDLPQLERLSGLLWMQPGFLAHSGPRADTSVRARSPVRLDAEASVDAALLINLSDGLDLSAHGAERLFELVGPGDEERAGGRKRFRRHQQARSERPEHVQVGA